MKKFLLVLFAGLFSVMFSGVNASDVPLGAGDVLKILVYGHSDLNLETKVSETGTITFPLIGEVKVAGLSAAATEKKIAEMLEGGGFIKKPQVNVILTLMQSQIVSVLGQVNKPGRYPLDGKRTIMDMIALAGGVNNEGGDSITLVRNQNGITHKEIINLADMVRSGDMKMDTQLQSGDLIYIERAPRFYIYGEVQRPGFYRLEQNMTVLQALSTGGGLTSRGTERGMRVKRRNKEGVIEVISVKNDDLLQENDVVYVKESLF